MILLTDPLVEKYANLLGTNLWLPFCIQDGDLLNWAGLEYFYLKSMG